jgi:hypothetical protein
MTYRITGLDPAPFLSLYGASDEALATRGARRMIADAKPGYPDRIALRDAEPGEAVILLNHEHQPAATPFRASHAIFVIEGATTRFDRIDELPPVMTTRTMSLRAFDADGMMTDGALASGGDLEPLIARMLSHSATAYLHAHYAARGCYAARIDRA